MTNFWGGATIKNIKKATFISTFNFICMQNKVNSTKNYVLGFVN